MRPLSVAIAVYAAITSAHHAYGKDPATNPGRAVLTLGIEIIEVAGECRYSGFGLYDTEGAYVSFLSINLVRNEDGNITDIRGSRVSVGGEDWDIFPNGPVFQEELGYSFEAQIRDSSLILGEPIPAHVVVTCSRSYDIPEEQPSDGPDWPETQN